MFLSASLTVYQFLFIRGDFTLLRPKSRPTTHLPPLNRCFEFNLIKFKIPALSACGWAQNGSFHFLERLPFGEKMLLKIKLGHEIESPNTETEVSRVLSNIPTSPLLVKLLEHQKGNSNFAAVEILIWRVVDGGLFRINVYFGYFKY